MAITEQTPYNNYTGNSSTTVFAYTFKTFVDTDLKVYVDSVLQTLTTNYTVSGVGAPGGGNVTFLVAPATGKSVQLVRSIPYDRLVDYQTSGDLLADTLDDDIDRVECQIQQLNQIAADTVGSALPGGNYDAKSRRIINLADPVDAQVAMTYASSLTSVTAAQTAQAAAEVAQAAAETAETNAETAQSLAESAQAAAEAAADTIPAYEALTGEALNFVRLNAAENTMEFRTPTEVLTDLSGIDNTWSGSQRGTVVTDNDLSFDMNAGQNFSCTPTGSGTLTFTNITEGQSGFIYLSNTTNYTISKAAAVKCGASLLATISVTGSYLLNYFSPDGTSVYVTASGALS